MLLLIIDSGASFNRINEEQFRLINKTSEDRLNLYNSKYKSSPLSVLPLTTTNRHLTGFLLSGPYYFELYQTKKLFLPAEDLQAFDPVT